MKKTLLLLFAFFTFSQNSYSTEGRLLLPIHVKGLGPAEDFYSKIDTSVITNIDEIAFLESLYRHGRDDRENMSELKQAVHRKEILPKHLILFFLFKNRDLVVKKSEIQTFLKPLFHMQPSTIEQQIYKVRKFLNDFDIYNSKIIEGIKEGFRFNSYFLKNFFDQRSVILFPNLLIIKGEGYVYRFASFEILAKILRRPNQDIILTKSESDTFSDLISRIKKQGHYWLGTLFIRDPGNGSIKFVPQFSEGKNVSFFIASECFWTTERSFDLREKFLPVGKMNR